MQPGAFPRERLAAMLRRLPAYLRLSWRLAKDPLVGRVRRAAVVAAAGYLASPIDLVPGVLPVVGQLDDLAVALAAIRIALAGLDAERRQAHLAAVGLRDGDLTDDLGTLWATMAWIGRSALRASGRALAAGVRATGSGARGAAAAVRHAGPLVRAGGARVAPVADAVGPAASAVGRTGLDIARATAHAGARGARAAASRVHGRRAITQATSEVQ